MLHGSGRLIVSASVCFRQVTALILVIMVVFFMPGATAHGACVDLDSSHSAIAPASDALPAGQEGPGDHRGGDSQHRECCKCPCHGFKILISPTRIGLSGHDFGSAWHPPHDEQAVESPVFKIFQPPKLPV